MNARLDKGNILSAAKRILGLAGLASLVLVCAGAARAQAQPSQAQSTAAPSGATVPATAPGIGPSESAPAARQVVAQNPSAKPSVPKGPSEGIKVHGHWTIEVRNPDGSVAVHRDFENSLITTGGTTGSQALVALLSGNGAAAGWVILLGSTVGGDVTPCATGNECFISASVSPALNTNVNNNTCGAGSENNCLPNQLTLSGTVPPVAAGTSCPSPAPGNEVCQSGTIDTVATTIAISQITSRAISNSPALGFDFTNAFSSATPPPFSAVPVAAGQTINVTVTISFQ